MSIWLRSVKFLLLLGVVVGGIFALLTFSKQPQHFPVRVVEIQEGLQHTTREEISSAISKHLENGFFWFNVDAVKKSLSELPWVSEVLVKRTWPDRIKISLKERTALARWGEKGLLSTEGVIFYPMDATNLKSLPRFYGPDSRAKEVLQQYFTLLEMLKGIGLNITELTLSNNLSWRMMLDNGIAIILGKAALNERMGRFVLIYPPRLKQESHKIAYLDLRYTNGIAIGWKKSE